ncbi:MAG TPA: choice-of-anchor D domain-containing protein, partial [Bacteroidales bacterium]|nr:choice-of-anchor D domain-containing protein [Bacteroidales bacterium]
ASSEYATLIVEGQTIGIIEDYNVSNNTNIVRTYGFAYAQIASWIADGSITVTIQNSGQVDAFSGDGNYHSVRMVVNAAPWLGLSSTTDTVVSGDSVQLSISFISTGMLSRTYYSSIQVSSNDPYTPTVVVPCTLTVAGPAAYALADSCLWYGTVLVGNTLRDTTTLFNPGCDTLEISSAQSTLADYSLISYPTMVMPNSSGQVIVAFSPSAVGTYSADIVFQSNAGPFQLCLNGIGAAPPVLEYSPTSVTANITVCHDTLTEWLAISNSGVEDLIFDLGGTATDSVRILAVRYTDNSTIFNSVISALNQHFTDYELTQTTTTSAATLASLLNGKDLVLFTRFTAANAGVFTSFGPVLQNFVAQGGVVLFSGIYDAGYSQNMYATGLLSGNYHSYITGGTIGLSSTDPLTSGLPASISATSYVFNHMFTNPDLVRVGNYGGLDVVAYRTIGAGRVIYLGYDFYNYNDYAAQILGRAVASASRGGLPDWLRVDPAADTVSSGDTSYVKLVFDAAGLTTGTFVSDLVIRTNVPGSQGDSVALTLNLAGYPIISVPQGLTDLGSVMIGGSLSGQTTISNTGCDVLTIT